MKAFLKKHSARRLIFLVLAISGLSACGSSGAPIQMTTSSTVVVGDADGSPLKFIVNPQQQDIPGTLTAEIANELRDRFELDVTSFETVANFPGIGDIQLILDPNFVSTATVFKLNRNNNPFGANTMDLSLIVETPEQNLTYSHISLQSNTATLTLTESLPTLTFFLQGQPKDLDLSALTVQIPADLIVQTQDMQ